jgi:hypothetical protein
MLCRSGCAAFKHVLILQENDKGFEVLTTVVMKDFISWDITLFKINVSFGGTYRFYLQDRIIQE